MPRALILCHEPFAASALIGRLLVDRGYEVTTHVVLADPSRPNTEYPSPGEFDLVLAFGSFANAYDESARAWVDPEVALLRQVAADDIPYLGVCFGGQLLAEALGGHVERAPQGEQEIGLVTFDPDRRLPVPSGPWFTWHEDRVVVPEGVEVLAHNGRAVQLFRKGRAVGTQFHPEAEPDLVRTWLDLGSDHLPAGVTRSQLLQDMAIHEEAMRENCAALLDWFLADVAGIEE